VDEQERRERKLEAYEMEELEKSGLEKMGDVSLDVDEELVLVGGPGPVPYRDLLSKEEYQAFRDLAEKKEPTEEHAQDEEARGSYQRHAFEASPTDDLHVLMLVKDLRNTFSAGSAGAFS
jgi:hypothetical protein